MHLADDLNAHGEVKTNGHAPFVIERYTLTTNNSNQSYETSYSTSDWAAVVVGYSAGYGRLDWNTVKNLIKKYLGDLDILIEVYLNYKKDKQKQKKSIQNDRSVNLKPKLSDYGIS